METDKVYNSDICHCKTDTMETVECSITLLKIQHEPYNLKGWY